MTATASSDPRATALRPVQRHALDAALVQLREEAGDLPAGTPPRTPGTCGVLVQRGRWAGKRCPKPAGFCTPNAGDGDEPGYGPCWVHGGVKLRGRAEAGWAMAHRFALEYNCSPWEGLLKAVRIAAGKVAYIEWVLSQASDDLELEGRFARTDDGILLHPDTGEPLGGGHFRNLSWWVMKGELWVDRLAKYSKAAIDAGVAERLVDIERAHAEQVAQVLNSVITAIESDGLVDDVTMVRLRGIMRQQLMALDAAETGQREVVAVVNGEAV